LKKTLGVKLSDEDFRIAYLKDYVRSWTLYHDLNSYSEERQKLVPSNKKYVVYLDISEDPGNEIFGSLVHVTPQQLSNFDKRELNYYRLNVSDKLDFNHSGTEGQVYIGCSYFKTNLVPIEECVIVKEYIDIVEKGLEKLGEGFSQKFWRTTQPTEIDILSILGFYPN